MKKSLKLMKQIFLILILCPLIVYAQNNAKGFTITGALAGVPDGTEIKLTRNGENIEFAKTKTLNGNFLLTGNVKEPVLCFLSIGDKPVELYLENSKITIGKSKDQPEKYIINGSATHKDFQIFLDTFLPLFQQLSSLANTINSMIPGPERDGQMNIYIITQQNIQKEIDKYIADKSHSLVSVFVLNVTSQFYDDPVLLEKRFNQLDSKIRKSDGGV